MNKHPTEGVRAGWSGITNLVFTGKVDVQQHELLDVSDGQMLHVDELLMSELNLQFWMSAMTGRFDCFAEEHMKA